MSDIKFIGQAQILKELKFICNEAKKGINLNLLLKAQSGYGKTTLAKLIAFNIGERYEYILCKENLEGFSRIHRVKIFDEIHMLKAPEFLYPYMDSGKFFLIFCTNEFGELKEPLVNRCIPFIFSEYSEQEMLEIINTEFQNQGFSFDGDTLKSLIKNSNSVPREAVNLAKRLSIIFRGSNVFINSQEEMDKTIEDYLGITNGLSPFHKSYLEFLRKVGTASLDRISFGISLDKKTIQRTIEPILIKKGLITVTSKGRGLTFTF